MSLLFNRQLCFQGSIESEDSSLQFPPNVYDPQRSDYDASNSLAKQVRSSSSATPSGRRGGGGARSL